LTNKKQYYYFLSSG